MTKKIIITLYILIVVCIGFATIVEKYHGTAFVSEHIYGAWWFSALWGVLTIAACAYMLKQRLYKRLAVFLLHASFVVILAGALTTHLFSKRGTVRLRTGVTEINYVDKEGKVERLPFSLKLKEFRIVNYPGTDAPLDYQSVIEHITNDQSPNDQTTNPPNDQTTNPPNDQTTNEGDGGRLLVSMNNVGNIDGYRLFQQSYDTDGKGVTLGVSYDPWGIDITYTGYLLLLIGIIATLLSRKTRMRELYHKAMRPLAVILLLSPLTSHPSPLTSHPSPLTSHLSPLTSHPSLLTSHLCSRGFAIPAPLSASDGLPVIDKDIAHRMGNIHVLYNNRICPLNTVATDFAIKMTGSASWHGYSADEIFFSWMIYYSPWEKELLLNNKRKGADERNAVVEMFYNGQFTKIFPYCHRRLRARRPALPMRFPYCLPPNDQTTNSPNDQTTNSPNDQTTNSPNDQTTNSPNDQTTNSPNDQTTDSPNDQTTNSPNDQTTNSPNDQTTINWYSPGGQVLPREIPVKEQFFIKQSMDFLTEAIVTGQKERAFEIIAKIKLFQHDMIGDLLPTASTTKAELFYNSLRSQKWPVFLALTLSILLCVLMLTSCLPPNDQTTNSPNDQTTNSPNDQTTNSPNDQTTNSPNDQTTNSPNDQTTNSPNDQTTNSPNDQLTSFKGKWLRGLSLSFVTLLLVYVTLQLGLRWWLSGHIPVSNGPETMLFMAWALLLFTILLCKRVPIITAFAPLVSSFCLLVAMLGGSNSQISPLMPVLQSPLLSVHVMSVMCAYSLFALQMLLGIYALFLKRKPQKLEQMTALSQLLLYPAVFLLTIGIFLGAVWANVSWGNYWSWDPKETWALITLMVYAVPFHSTSIPLFRSPLRYHLYIVCAFLSVVITYFGVNYLLGGMHSYA